MNNRIKVRGGRWLALLLALAVLAGCGSAQAGSGSPPEAGARNLRVVASFQTMGEFTRLVAGDRAEVTVLVPTGADAHDWEPSPRDIGTLEQADLLILSGAGFEHWSESVLATLQNESLAVVDTSKAISSLLAAGEEHDHPEEESHDHGDWDPHIWLSPPKAKEQLAAIRDGLAEVDPDGADAYEANYQSAAGEMDRLDQEYRETLASLPGREIVVAHAAFGYLCAEYGLQQVAVQGLSPEGEPNPARMAQIIDYAAEHQVKVVFFEEMASPKVAEAIAREIGAQTGVLNPLEGLTEEQLAAGEDYFSVMRENLSQLKVALA